MESLTDHLSNISRGGVVSKEKIRDKGYGHIIEHVPLYM